MSSTRIHRPHDGRILFAYFRFNAFVSDTFLGAARSEGWILTLSVKVLAINISSPGKRNCIRIYSSSHIYTTIEVNSIGSSSHLINYYPVTVRVLSLGSNRCRRRVHWIAVGVGAPKTFGIGFTLARLSHWRNQSCSRDFKIFPFNQDIRLYNFETAV